MSNKIEELEKEIKELKAQRELIEQQIETKVKMIEKSVQFYVNTFGEIGELPDLYKSEKVYFDMVKQGNVFNSREEAEKEIKKRVLMFELEEFRNERNGCWRPDFEGGKVNYCIVFRKNELFTLATSTINYFPEFGYFRILKDCERAKEIFGTRILELYAD